MLRKSRQSAPIFVNIDTPDSSKKYYHIRDLGSPLEKYFFKNFKGNKYKLKRSSKYMQVIVNVMPLNSAACFKVGNFIDEIITRIATILENAFGPMETQMRITGDNSALINLQSGVNVISREIQRHLRKKDRLIISNDVLLQLGMS